MLRMKNIVLGIAGNRGGLHNSINCFCFETKDRHASAKAQMVVDHLTSFMSSREEISQPGIKLPTSSLEIWVSLHHHLVV